MLNGLNSFPNFLGKSRTFLSLAGSSDPAFLCLGGQALDFPSELLKGHAPGGFNQDHRPRPDQVGQKLFGRRPVPGIQRLGDTGL